MNANDQPDHAVRPRESALDRPGRGRSISRRRRRRRGRDARAVPAKRRQAARRCLSSRACRIGGRSLRGWRPRSAPTANTRATRRRWRPPDPALEDLARPRSATLFGAYAAATLRLGPRLLLVPAYRGDLYMQGGVRAFRCGPAAGRARARGSRRVAEGIVRPLQPDAVAAPAGARESRRSGSPSTASRRRGSGRSASRRRSPGRCHSTPASSCSATCSPTFAIPTTATICSTTSWSAATRSPTVSR